MLKLSLVIAVMVVFGIAVMVVWLLNIPSITYGNNSVKSPVWPSATPTPGLSHILTPLNKQGDGSSQSSAGSSVTPTTVPSHSSTPTPSKQPGDGSSQSSAGSSVTPTAVPSHNPTPTPSNQPGSGSPSDQGSGSSSDQSGDSSKVIGYGARIDAYDPKSFVSSQVLPLHVNIYSKGNKYLYNLLIYNTSDTAISWSLSVQYDNTAGGWMSFDPIAGTVPPHTPKPPDQEDGTPTYGSHMTISNEKVHLPVNHDYSYQAHIILTTKQGSNVSTGSYEVLLLVSPQPALTLLPVNNNTLTITIAGALGLGSGVKTVTVGKTSTNNITDVNNGITIPIPPGSSPADVVVEFNLNCDGRYPDEECLRIDAGTFMYPANSVTTSPTPTLTSTPTPTPTSST